MNFDLISRDEFFIKEPSTRLHVNNVFGGEPYERFPYRGNTDTEMPGKLTYLEPIWRSDNIIEYVVL